MYTLLAPTGKLYKTDKDETQKRGLKEHMTPMRWAETQQKKKQTQVTGWEINGTWNK